MYPLLVFLVCTGLISFNLAKSQERVFCGDRVSISQYPYVVSVRNQGIHFCTGSILTFRTVITAGHCTYNISVSNLSIRAGSSFRTSGGTIFQVRDYRLHPNFSRVTLNFDVALLYLSSLLTFGSTIRPIQLYRGSIKAGRTIAALGWGRLSEDGDVSNVLRWITFKTQPTKTCKLIWGETLRRGMFCAGVMDGSRDTCQGVSGGPATRNHKLIGITSFGNGCGKPGFPGVYTRIPIVRRWIKRNVDWW